VLQTHSEEREFMAARQRPREQDDLVRVRCHECHRLLSFDSLREVHHFTAGKIWLCARCDGAARR